MGWNEPVPSQPGAAPRAPRGGRGAMGWNEPVPNQPVGYSLPSQQ